VIWWLWRVLGPDDTGAVHVVDLGDWWRADDPDVAWLGECAWTCRTDNTGLGLR